MSGQIAPFQPRGQKWADERLAEGRRAREPYEPEWYLNLAYFQGDQWCAWDGRGLYHPRIKSRVKLTDNRIMPAILTEVARLTKSRPGWGATPRGLEDEAVQHAAAAVRLLDWNWDHLNMPATRREAVLWSRICSAGFVKTVFDANVGEGVEAYVDNGGKAVPNPKTGRPLRKGDDPELEQSVTGLGATTKRIGGGEVVHRVRSPFNIYVDPLATRHDLSDARWLIDESVLSPEAIKAEFGKDVNPDAPSEVGIVESRFMAAGIQQAAGGGKVGVRVWELWAPPTKLEPQGRRIVWTQQGVLFEGPNEYGCIPYTMIPGRVVPGRFWPDAVATQMRPIQSRRNKILSQIAENLARFGNPSILIDRLSGVTYHGVPGEIIQHNAAGEHQLPQFLQPPTVPSYGFNLVQLLDESERQISGQFEVSQGGVPSGVTAAAAISQLTEQADTRLGPEVETLELALADIGQKTLDLQVRFYTTEKIVVIVGEDGIIDVDAFRASAGFQVPTVTVVPNSTFPRSLAAKQAAIRDILNMFFQYGVPVDAAALTYVLRDMQVGGLERLVGSYSADVNQVSREHVDFLRGATLAVNEVDNDAVHIAGHEDFAKTARFRQLPEPQQRELIQHIREHRASAQTKAGAPQGPAAPQFQPLGAVNDGSLPPGTVPTEPSGNPLPPEQPGLSDLAA